MTKRETYIVLAAGMAVGAAASAGRGATLVEKGKPVGVIVLPAKPGAVLSAAASDLQDHLRRMSGAAVPIRTAGEAASGPGVYLGCGTDRNRKVDPARVWPDGYRLRVTAEGIYIGASREEGLRNGIYGLLEDHLGCRWYTPGEIGTVVPGRTTIALPEMDEVTKPGSDYRNPWYNGGATARMTKEEMRQVELWRVRNRVGGMRGYCGHYWYIIFPRKLQEQHPDLAPFYNGRRNPGGDMGGGQICLSNPRAVAIAAQHLIDLFNRQPGLDFYSLAQNDGRGWCECESCRSLGANNGERMLRFSNRVAEKVAAVHPGKGLAILLYAGGTIEPPEQDVRAHPALYPVVCSYQMEQVRPLSDGCDWNRTFRRRVERWMTMVPRAWCYDYIGWYPGPWTLFHNLEEDQAYYRRLGYTGNLSEYMDRDLGTDLFMWLSLKLAWNPELKVDDLLDAFYPAYFGPAAATMRGIYERFEQHMLSAGGSGEIMDVPRLYPTALVDDALARIAAARAGLADDTVRGRLERDANCLRLTRHFLDFWGASGRFRRSGDTADRQQAVRAGRAYLDLLRGLAGALTVGGARGSYVEGVLASFEDPGTAFGEAGEFIYEDDLNDGGKSYQALRRSGYFIGMYGLYLAPNAAGEIVYDFRAAAGLVFQGAKLVNMHVHVPEGGRNGIDISRDGGQTWATAHKDLSMGGGTAERDLTVHIAGAQSFLLRFRHANGPRETLAIDHLKVSGTIAASAQAGAQP